MRPAAERLLQAAALVLALSAPGTGGSSDARAAGALAVGRCDRYGYTYSLSTSAAAQSDAIAKCAAAGDYSCHVVVNVNRECLAFAVDSDNTCGARGWSYAPSLEGAQQLALGYCRQYGGAACVIRIAVCDGG